VSERFDPFAATRWLPWIVGGLVLLFLALPLLVVIPTAFSASSLLRFPPRAFSLRWFHEYFGSDAWMRATWVSVKAAVVVSLVSTLLGLGLAITFDRFTFFGRNLLRALVMAPLMVPVVVIGVGLYVVFLRTGLNGTFLGLVIGHTVVTFPYATVVIGASLREVDRRLEQAAIGLGANPVRAFAEVTLPLIAPGIVVSALFGFLVSFDEVVIAIFVTGPETATLPRQIWDGIRFDLNPTIAAVATLLIALSGIVLLASELLRRLLHRRAGIKDLTA
jgi:putative spermidine/putrescine transport system permease protein